MNGWRVTKYDPSSRDESGSYIEDDWISFGDVGRTFDGRVLTFEEYLSVESAYVESAIHFLAESKIDGLTITDFEAAPIDRDRLKFIDFDPRFVRKGMTLAGYALADVCRMNLRDILWCKLETPDSFYLHFGWDYYMYIGSRSTPEASISLARQRGLFVEEMPSPYLSERQKKRAAKMK